MTRSLRLACIDSAAMPLFDLARADGRREGYEPELAEELARRIGARLEWAVMPWDEMIPAVQRGDADAVWCGQGIIPSRQEEVAFTRPYAIFDETVLVRAGDPARGPGDLEGYRVAAIAASANLRLAETFAGAIVIPFASSDDVFGDMIEALRRGDVDAMVDDDVVTVPLGDDPDFDVAFTAPTQNPWGIGVAKDRPELLDELDRALAGMIEDGFVEARWRQRMPALPFPAQGLAAGRPS